MKGSIRGSRPCSLSSCTDSDDRKSDTTDTSSIASSTTHPSPTSTDPTKDWADSELSASNVDFLSLEFARSEEVQNAIRCWKEPASLQAPSQCIRHLSLLEREAMFKSLCVAETTVMGNPIEFYSKRFHLGPQGLRVGECMFLNHSAFTGQRYRMDTVMREGGRPGFVLEWSTELFRPNINESTLFLSSQFEITETFRNLAVQAAAHAAGTSQTTAPSLTEFDWSQFVEEAGYPHSDRFPQVPASDTVTRVRGLGTEAQVIANKIRQLQSYSQECFVLTEATSAAIEITPSAVDLVGLRVVFYVSSSVCTSDVTCTFTSLARETSHELEQELAGRKNFNIALPWGRRRVLRRLYFLCIDDGRPAPRAQRGWACFPVDIQSPLLW
jgi:hypothetical protein